MSLRERFFNRKVKTYEQTIQEAENLMHILTVNDKFRASYVRDIESIRPDTPSEEAFRRKTNLDIFQKKAATDERAARKQLLSQ